MNNPAQNFDTKQWQHMINNGIESAKRRSIHQGNQLHRVLDFWEPLCDMLQNKHGWNVNYPIKDLLIENLRDGNLIMRWINSVSLESVSYCDDEIQSDDVIWGVNWPKFNHFVGRIKCMIFLEGIFSIKDRDNNILRSRAGCRDRAEFFLGNFWHEIREREFLKHADNLNGYIETLPNMHEHTDEWFICNHTNVLQRVHYRHLHVHMPRVAYDKVWKKGCYNWNAKHVNKLRLDYQNWRKENKFWYRWGLETAGEDLNSWPWCGTRYKCVTHQIWECHECRGHGIPLTAIHSCKDDGNYVVFGIPQGHINKWNMNGSWKR